MAEPRVPGAMDTPQTGSRHPMPLSPLPGCQSQRPQNRQPLECRLDPASLPPGHCPINARVWGWGQGGPGFPGIVQRAELEGRALGWDAMPCKLSQTSVSPPSQRSPARHIVSTQHTQTECMLGPRLRPLSPADQGRAGRLRGSGKSSASHASVSSSEKWD